jgi:hypothetical protein
VALALDQEQTWVTLHSVFWLSDDSLSCFLTHLPSLLFLSSSGIADNCNSNTESWSSLGASYDAHEIVSDPVQTTYRERCKTVFAGSWEFPVKDYEVFTPVLEQSEVSQAESQPSISQK